MTNTSLIERITRSLAYMLRHKPEEFDIELDGAGSADCFEVVQVLNERLGEAIEEDDLLEAIEAGDRVRYAIDDGRIRALYGHSIEVDPGEPAKPQELLYVGLGSRDAERAGRYGLRAGRRSFLHLAKDEEQAIESGRRQARRYVVITVYALDAWEQGINFYDRGSLYLSDPIPTEFLETGEVHEDGSPSTRDAGRGGRSGGSRPRDRDRNRGDRGRGGDRQGRNRDRDEVRSDSGAERDSRRPAGRRDSEGRGSRSEGGGGGGGGDRPSSPRRESPVEVPKATPATTFGVGLKNAGGRTSAPVKKAPRPAKASEPESPPQPKPAPANEGPSFGSGV